MPATPLLSETRNGDSGLSNTRRASAIMSASSDVLKNIVGTSEHRAIWAGVAVVAGVAVELGLAFFSSEPMTLRIETGLADAIVALGVAAELWFGRRGASAQSELTRRAELDLAQAIERASNAERETEKIKLLTAWRHVPAQFEEALVASLKGNAASVDLLVEYQMGDPEAYSYACEIMDAFSKAGISKMRFCSNSHMGAPVFGLLIGPAVFAPNVPPPFLMPIASAFNDAGLEIVLHRIDLTTHLPRNFTAPNLYMFVAPKPPKTPPVTAQLINPMAALLPIPAPIEAVINSLAAKTDRE